MQELIIMLFLLFCIVIYLLIKVSHYKKLAKKNYELYQEAKTLSGYNYELYKIYKDGWDYTINMFLNNGRN
jgi:hypothetical protein